MTDDNMYTGVIFLMCCLLWAGWMPHAAAQNNLPNLGTVSDRELEVYDNPNNLNIEGRTLEDFFTAAINFNPSLEIARERWNIGTARKQQATGQLLPQISASAQITENDRNSFDQPPIDFRGERFAVQLRQVLFDWQSFSARGRASLEEDQAEAEYYAELALLLTDVSEKYFDVLQARDALETAEAEVEAVRNQVEQLERMYDLQLARVTDLSEAQARLEAVRADRLDRENELYIAREKLSSATGISVGRLFELADDNPIPPLEAPIDEWVRRARDGNQQIQARMYALRAAEKGVSEQRGNYMPRVSLIAQQQRSDVGFDNVPLSRYDAGYVGVEVSMPLFAGGSNRARVSEARSRRAIAENELRQMQLDIMERTRTAFLQARATANRIEAARRLVEATETNAEAMRRGFELGTVTNVEVLNAIRDRFQAQRDLQRSRYEHVKARLQLQREAGTLSADDIMEVSSWLEAP